MPPKNNTANPLAENIDQAPVDQAPVDQTITDPSSAADDTGYEDPQPARDAAAEQILTKTAGDKPVSVRILTDYQPNPDTTIKAGHIAKLNASAAAGLVTAGIADASPESVAYALDNGAEVFDI